MRILVTVGASHAELERDLARLSARARSSRLKTLATLGLLVESSGAQIGVGGVAAGVTEKPPARVDATSTPRVSLIDADFADSVGHFRDFG